MQPFWKVLSSGGVIAIRPAGSEAARVSLPLDADGEIQIDALVGDKAVLKVQGKTRVGDGVIALRNRSPEESRGVGGLDDVQRRPTAVAGGEAF